MKLESEFSVPAHPSTVFKLFFDPEVMRGCIPGCEELVRVDDTTYTGRLVNEVAHVRFSAGFSATIRSIDEAGETRTVTALLKGEDRRLGSSIKIDATLTVRPNGDEASVIGYRMDMALWGKLGRLGEPIIRRRSREVELEFARSLAIACGAPAEAVPQKEKPRKKVVARPAAAQPVTAAPTPDLAIAATRKLAVVATVVSVVALVVAVLKRGR
ncbi:CoxG family protein [Actinophytocola sp. NPDC049390]|uniref:CoxG family protein n=1 Tax=Actinophytocola sp. NPDC049390 TaxID=3363894 RepID=UPI0037AD3D00